MNLEKDSFFLQYFDNPKNPFLILMTGGLIMGQYNGSRHSNLNSAKSSLNKERPATTDSSSEDREDLESVIRNAKRSAANRAVLVHKFTGAKSLHWNRLNTCPSV